MEVLVEADDGHRFALFLVAAEGDGPVVLFFPAMGVRAEKYVTLGQAFGERGCCFAIAELRGHGTSSLRAARGCNYGYREMVEHDWPAALAALRARFPDRGVVLMGHSLGGQLSCLYAAAHPGEIEAVVLTAACSVYYRNFHKRYAFRLLLAVIAPIVGLLGYFPGDRLGFARREGARVMRDWAHQGRTGRYRIAGSAYDYEALLAELALPVLAVSIDGDQFCPPAAVAHLCDKLVAAEVDRMHLDGFGEPGSGPHFAWLKRPGAIVATVLDWLSPQRAKTL